MTRIEVFADIACPFAHVGLRRLVEARRARGAHARLRVRAWPLEWVNGSQIDRELVATEVDALRSQVAVELFAGFDTANFPSTSIPAFGLAAAAYAVDDAVGEAVSLAVRDALFERGLDVTNPNVLDAIAKQFGVESLEPDAAESAIRTDWERGRARGVRGSPHYFAGDRDWFCPSLVIHHEHDSFDTRIADETMREFYAAALG
ncbi:MAG: DsbA family protein [Acidimicrobiia bacterium]